MNSRGAVPAVSPATVGAVDADQADEEARHAVALGVWVSGLRCLIVYVLAPLVGGFAGFLGVIGLTLQIAGAITSCAGARELRRRRHPARHPYTAVAAVVVAATVATLFSYLT